MLSGELVKGLSVMSARSVMAQLAASVAVQLSTASQPVRLLGTGLDTAEGACGPCEVSVKAAGP